MSRAKSLVEHGSQHLVGCRKHIKFKLGLEPVDASVRGAPDRGVGTQNDIYISPHDRHRHSNEEQSKTNKASHDAQILSSDDGATPALSLELA
jgi:hypothetical protein